MDKEDLLEADLIHQKIILVRLPVVSLLRFKSVCKSWCSLIQSPSFIHLHTIVTTFKSSSSRFGSFILHVAVQFPKRFREDALLVLSSLSESESECCVSWCSGSFGLWSTPGFNGICGLCESRGKSGFLGWMKRAYVSIGPGSGGWWWRTSDGLCGDCQISHNFVQEHHDDDDEVFRILGGGGVSNDNDDEQLVLKLDNLGFPSCYNFGKPPHRHRVMVVGSCNGLICLHDSERSDVSLWNPATRQFRILPKSITFDGDCLHHRLFAFGFDAETKDYKVVLLSGFRLRPRRIIDGGISVLVGPMECFCRVQVYSLSTDSWRLLEGINVLPGSPFPYPPDSSSGQGQLLYLNGSCFFMAKFSYSEEEEECIPPPPKDKDKDNDRFIISLDLTKEIIIPLPGNQAGKELYLCYLGNKIALITTIAFRDTGEIFRIYVLNEHCSSSSLNNDSWIELHFFGIKLGLPGEWYIPRGISNDGVFVFLETGTHGLGNKKKMKKKKKKMKLYNIVTEELKENFISCDQVVSKAYAYKPSLASIIGGNA